MKKHLILLLLLQTFFVSKSEDKIIFYDEGTSDKYIGKQTSIFSDVSGKLDFNSILELDKSNFVRSNENVPNLNVSSSNHWIRLRIVNKSSKDNFVLFVDQPSIDYVDIYYFENDTLIHRTSGDVNHSQNRSIFDFQNAFKIDCDTNDEKEIYIKLAGGEHIHAAVRVTHTEKYRTEILNKHIFMGVFMGIFIALILYNLFIYFSTRDKSYIIYVTYLVIVGLTQLNFQGYASFLVWGNNPLISKFAVYVLSSLTAILAIEFMRNFLNTRVNTKKLDSFFPVFHIVYLISFLFAVFGKFQIAYIIIQINASVAATYMLVVAITLSLSGNRSAKFFLLAWVAFLVGVTIYVSKDINLLPYNFFTVYTMPIGSAIEVILLSFALADRINILKKEKEESQLLALKAAQENEKLVTEQNVILEEKVKQRTEQLESTNHQLEHTLENLKSAQTNLVEAEKMASLGQLTAGIAHEINNPINFVSSNIYPLKLDFQDVLSVVDEYDKMKEGIDPETVLKNVEALKESIDYDFVKKEIDQLLKGIEDGAQRTFEIVQGLKNFSYLDEADHKPADINNGIKSTLVLLKTLTNGDITIEKDFGDLPLVECYPGKLNQVFMNILSNAIQAIKSKPVLENEKISIKTYIEGDNAVLRFSDTGPGIPENIRSKIFDPFFTTKDVGQGTGLGLSIVYNIIKKHDGSITLESEVGKGTTFVIKLPLSQKGS